jgi:hypothetical protein
MTDPKPRDDALISAEKRSEDGRFIVPPLSPGRPKGARNKLGEKFVEDLLADWEEHGVAAIAEVRAEKPDQYLKVVASVIPKELNVTVQDYDDLSDDELAARFAAAAARLVGGHALGGRGRAKGEGEGRTAPLPN